MRVNRNYCRSNNDVSCEKIWRYTFACLVFTLLLSSCEIQARHKEGDSCELTNGETGKCKNLAKCQSVYDEFLAGNSPDTVCGFSEYDPIICCPLTGADETTLNPTRSTTKHPANTINGSPGDLARQKCAEYSQLVYAVVDRPALTVFQDPSVFRKTANISLCGIKSKKFIANRTKADPKEFPHMAMVGFGSDTNEKMWICGGALVSDRFVMTAAQCTFSLGLGEAHWVRLGDSNLVGDNDDARPQDRRIIEIIRYPDYKKPAGYHDIALLRLESSVRFDAYTRPACLLTSRFEGPASIATIRGAVDFGDIISNDLMKVTLKTVPHQSCNYAYYGDGLNRLLPRGIVDDWQFCAGGDGNGPCQGDAGAPLSIYNEDYECMYDVVGITSVGRLCGGVSPDVYTRVSNYISWLENIIWKS